MMEHGRGLTRLALLFEKEKHIFKESILKSSNCASWTSFRVSRIFGCVSGSICLSQPKGNYVSVGIVQVFPSSGSCIWHIFSQMFPGFEISPWVNSKNTLYSGEFIFSNLKNSLMPMFLFIFFLAKSKLWSQVRVWRGLELTGRHEGMSKWNLILPNVPNGRRLLVSALLCALEIEYQNDLQWRKEDERGCDSCSTFSSPFSLVVCVCTVAPRLLSSF